MKLNKKGESKKKWIKWVVGIVGTLVVLFVAFVLIFPEVFNHDQWGRIKGMWVFSTKFDSGSSWLTTMDRVFFSGDNVDFSSFPFLKEIIIWDNEGHPTSGLFLVTGLKRLKTITIGKHFTYYHGHGEDRKVEISHCPSLTSLVIGDGSFSLHDELILTGLFMCCV